MLKLTPSNGRTVFVCRAQIYAIDVRKDGEGSNAFETVTFYIYRVSVNCVAVVTGPCTQITVSSFGKFRVSSVFWPKLRSF